MNAKLDPIERAKQHPAMMYPDAVIRTRFLGGSKLNQLGMAYAQAGVHLRMAQTDNLPDHMFHKDVRLRREIPDRPRRFDDYAGW
jgi:hypothetical protein